MLTTRMTMNLNESNIIYPIVSIWFAKKLLDKNTIWLQHSCVCGSLAAYVRLKKKLLHDAVGSTHVCLLDVVATWWNTSDCKIRYSVVATTIMLRLQKTVAKKHVCDFAPLVTVWLRLPDLLRLQLILISILAEKIFWLPGFVKKITTCKKCLKNSLACGCKLAGMWLQ
jgi:hypothetical protein